MADKLIKIVEEYFTALRDVRRLGAGTPERSYYSALDNLLDNIGADLKGRVICLPDLGNTGAGHPDFGLYTKSQLQSGTPRKGQMPERGVIEMKPVADDAWLTAVAKQVTGYFAKYRLVIVTNLRDFLIIGEAPNGKAEKRESLRLAKDAAAFWELVSTPRKSAQRLGRAFGEYLKRALTQSVALREPKDLAWFLASYARDALQRVEAKRELPGLASIKTALEDALGMKFESERGEHFFRSTLVQTLFYGVFSSWVLWARQTPPSTERFEWRQAIWYLHVPFVSALFQQLASPKQLQPLGLVELLDWTEATLNRVVKEEFLQKFNDADAVQFFYEPFLEAFDPDLRKELGVWYTPSEVVTYMVARVDKALKDDLGVADGLAADNVYVLDPCCGTGAYVTAVLKRIDRTLDEKGLGGLKGQMVKKAALGRVLGFEIMPAPFIVAHLRVGSELQRLGASLKDHERASVYLTNALTGWEPENRKPLPFPGLEEERKKAEQLKQKAPILVILGNPPYNGFAGVTIGEERDLSEAYRKTEHVRKPEGQGLNDLYVRFYRMAERRIVEKTGRGIVCFITNFEWLDGSSHTGMRERFLNVFDGIRIDCLNGDSRETGKTTPDGKPDPSIFSTEHNREGIRKGTAISLLIRKHDHKSVREIAFREFWGASKRQDLLANADAAVKPLYSTVMPVLELGLPFKVASVSPGYLTWPKLPELLMTSFSGVKTARDDFLVDIDRLALEARIDDYFNPALPDDEIVRRNPVAMMTTDRFDAKKTRKELVSRGLGVGKIVRYVYRPFDVRWLYWEPETKLLDEKRADYTPHVFPGNRWISAAQALRRGAAEPQYAVFTAIGSYHVIERAALFFPEHLSSPLRPNISAVVERFLEEHSASVCELFSHIVAILNAPAYRVDNFSAIALDWPRVPLPGDANILRASAALGATLATLLDPETAAPGVSTGTLRAGLKTLGLPARRDGKGLDGDDLKLTARWGYTQNNNGSRIVMPGPGLVTQRAYTNAELAALAQEGKTVGLSLDEVLALVGDKTFDVHLNSDAWWSNAPARVWDYTLGGYQVIKKWLSYRERAVLGRALKPDEVIYVSEMVRRIAAILLMGPRLDDNYAVSKAVAVEWKDGAPVV
ncbi:MAG: N-6 DNA methylase [Hyphomicrobiaceae bacterium]|nr:N-6 DNA methylase [Hyphomicrobiaceae bacterium]